MAAMSLSLKHIPCPAGTNCSAYMCLFGHEREDKGSGAGGGSSAPTTEPEMLQVQSKAEVSSSPAVVSNRDGDAPLKRTKLDSPAPRTAAAANPPKPRSLHPGSDMTPAPSRLQSIKRPISPPVRKHQPTPNSLPTAQPKVPLAKPVVKKEALNPRLIKASPASHEIRLKLVRLLHNEYKRLNEELKKVAKSDQTRLLLSDQELITRVLDEEVAVAVGKASVYSNVMKNNIIKYKRFALAEWLKEREQQVPAPGKKRQLEEMQGGAVVVETGLTPAQEVQLLRRILTPIEGLGNHGYVSAVPTPEAIAAARDGLDAAKGWEKCDRCEQRFQVFPGRRAEDGALTSGGACNFHWGKTYFPDKQPGTAADRTVTRQPKRHLCCGQQVGDSAGCITHPNHVFKASDPKRLAAVLNYAATPENAGGGVPADRAVCFDCEMGYTVHGMELIRLTATSWPDGTEMLDVLVKPLGEILDLNSRYSGVWPDDLAQAQDWCPGDALVPASESSSSGESSGSEDGQVSKKRLKVVSSPAAARDLLFSLLAPTTPLMGHGLENDLNAVRVVHPTLVDTVLAFPHRAGLPFRNGLKALMGTHLNRKIQVQTGPKMLGHDSAEDARAAGELVRLRVAREWAELKRKGWKVVDGVITAPVSSGGGTLTEEFIEAAV